MIFRKASMEIMLRDPDIGPKGGSILRISDRRALDSESFVKLVRGTWIGTSQTVSNELHPLFPGLLVCRNGASFSLVGPLTSGDAVANE
jgi:hypothetical protein